MFREMRRKNQLLTPEETAAVLTRATSGVLALCDHNGYPYAVPLSYVYFDSKIYFHCAKTGHKLDALKHCPKASFCVVDQDRVMPGEYTTYFRSVIVFGTIRPLESDDAKRFAIEKLAQKYAPDTDSTRLQTAIRQEWSALCILEMAVEHATGKEAIELVRARQK